MIKPMISIIAAVGNNYELGANNDLLWHLPDDFKWFISKTKGKPIVMGRKTMESLGKPLKNRTNIVLSKSEQSLPEGFVKVDSFDRAFEVIGSENSEIMVIGGAQIYKQSMDFVDQLIITHVDAEFENADAFFPKINPNQWELTFEEKHTKDESHTFDFSFCIYQRK